MSTSLDFFWGSATVAMVASYLVGAIPFGLLLTRWGVRKDVRAEGSGNIGATNVARVAGKKLGAATLVFDALKGVAALLAAKAASFDGAVLGGIAVACVVGHCFPIYLKFKGGKGVATGLGLFFVLTPLPAAIGAVAYVSAFAWTRISSVGSIALLSTTLIATAIAFGMTWVLSTEALIVALILYRHKANIERLLQGNEAAFR